VQVRGDGAECPARGGVRRAVPPRESMPNHWMRNIYSLHLGVTLNSSKPWKGLRHRQRLHTRAQLREHVLQCSENLWPASSQSRRQLPLSNMFGFSCQLSALRRQSKYRMYITAGKGEDARRLRCAVNSPLSSLRPHASRILPDNISANAAGIYRIGVWQSCLLSALRCGFSHPPGCLQLRNNVMNLAHTGGDTPSTSTARSSCAFIVKCGENIGVSEHTHRKTAG
jgi:hypothetical protein